MEFQVRKPKTTLSQILTFLELIYHSIVRDVRKSGGPNALLGLLSKMSTAIMFVGAFYVMFEVVGMRGAALRGDYMLYIMSGILVFLVHTQSMGAVFGSEGPTAPMMKHAPMNTMVAICSSALSSLYTSILTITVMLFTYHVAMRPLEISQPMAALGMVFIAWFTGCSVGMLFLALKPWAPGVASTASTVYMRVNMIASGKMFVANTMPSFMIALFDWNPLFHVIDQIRGFVFINYNPHHTNVLYPLIIAGVLISLGLIGEHHTRKRASESWGTRTL
ncbi:MAG: ABC transporter permease [Pseudomonadota bacterium]